MKPRLWKTNETPFVETILFSKHQKLNVFCCFSQMPFPQTGFHFPFLKPGFIAQRFFLFACFGMGCVQGEGITNQGGAGGLEKH